MTRWNLVISNDTDRSVRSYLARTGGRKGDLSRFVDRAGSAIRRPLSRFNLLSIPGEAFSALFRREVFQHIQHFSG